MVSEEMIEAGVKAAYDFDLEIQPHADAVRAIYLAMLAASPIEDELVERLYALASYLRDEGEDEAAPIVTEAAQSIRVMREALERIANQPPRNGGFRKSLVAIARSALGASKEQSNGE